MNIIYQFRKDGKYGMSTFLHNCLGAGLQGEGTSYSTIESVNTVITDLGRLLLLTDLCFATYKIREREGGKK